MVWNDYKKAYDMVLQSWKVHCLRMYKIPNQFVQFIKKTMETWRVELTVGGNSLAEVKIQRGIFQKDTLSPLLSVIATVPLKSTAGYKLSKSKKIINNLMYMDDIKLLTKNKKGLESLIQTVKIYSQDIIIIIIMSHC